MPPVDPANNLAQQAVQPPVVQQSRALSLGLRVPVAALLSLARRLQAKVRTSGEEQQRIVAPVKVSGTDSSLGAERRTKQRETYAWHAGLLQPRIHS